MQFEYRKWLELLKQVASGVTRAAVLRDPAVGSGIGQFAAIQSVASSVGAIGANRTCKRLLAATITALMTLF
jgi:hypothetical protein